jgi:hypothetical protein
VKPSMAPSNSAPGVEMKPAAGVIPARPAIAPFIISTTFVLCLMPERTSQTTAEAEAPTCVLATTRDASPVDVRAEPALKPNQPMYSNAPPTQAMGTLLGLNSPATKKGKEGLSFAGWGTEFSRVNGPRFKPDSTSSSKETLPRPEDQGRNDGAGTSCDVNHNSALENGEEGHVERFLVWSRGYPPDDIYPDTVDVPA